MNSKKHKSKNRANKPSNPNPPQNVEPIIPVEVIEKTEEKPLEIQKESVIQEEHAQSASETTDVQVNQLDDTPKKPKRNKGKKKKSEKEEHFVDTQDEKIADVLVEEPQNFIESTQELVIEVNKEEETTASSSKNKKNRNKKNQQAMLQAPTLQDQKRKSCEKDLLKETPVTENIEIPALGDKSLTEQEHSSKKKNKKKKHRNDSEKSDKSEANLTCTSNKRFVNTDIPDNSSECKIRNEDLEGQSEGNIIIKSPLEEVEQNLGKDSKELDLPQTTESENVKKSLESTESKNKRKNKKDKKSPKTEFTADLQSTHLPQDLLSEILLDSSTVNIDSQNISEEITINDESILQLSSKETFSAKSENLISKEKDMKQCESGKEEILNIKVEPVRSEEKFELQKDNIDKKEETNLFLKEHVQVLEEKQDIIDSNKEREIIPLKTDTITSVVKDKKRKKSPKLLISDSTENIKDPEPAKYDNLLETSKKSSDITVEFQTPLQELHQESKSVLGKVSETIPTENKKIEMEISTQSQNIYELPKVDSDIKSCDDVKITNVASGKKRKKAQKFPPQIKDFDAELLKKEAAICTNPTENFNIESSSTILPLQRDVKISSMKTDESEISSCDVTPDIHYRRSSSNQFLDNNNNMIIREIKTSAPVNLIVPTPDIPFMEQTNVSCPADLVFTSETIATKINQNITKDEKTDIKSKMLEVNQDMEELRLSIERSLAEFTSMELNEQKREENFTKINTGADNVPALPGISKEANITKCDKILDLLDEFGSPSAEQTCIKSIEAKTEMLPSEPIKSENKEHSVTLADTIVIESQSENKKMSTEIPVPPICPSRKDNKGKSKSKKKGKQEVSASTSSSTVVSTQTPSHQTESKKEDQSEKKSEQKTDNTQEKTQQNSDTTRQADNNKPVSDHTDSAIITDDVDFEPIENFEDALTSSVDDVNKTFEMIADEAKTVDSQINSTVSVTRINPEINVIAPDETDNKKQERKNPVSQPKNLLGQPGFPVRSSKVDYKKEKHKTPNERLAKVKIKDSAEVEKKCKESQTANKQIYKKTEESSKALNGNEEYIYKYSFRKVFLQSACHVCKKDLVQSRVSCNYCNLVFYCSTKHKNEDWPHHQGLCFAISTVIHFKDQKHIYSDAKNTTGHSYRLIRMQMILSCEKVLKRKLEPWEQEALLYPRMCADIACREWRQSKLKDCDGCFQISYCVDHLEHLPKTHQRWCKSYSLYKKLVDYQQIKGRLEPKLPTRVMKDDYQIPEKMNEVLASLFEEKIDMNDIQYAALTQVATAPLTTAFSYELCNLKMTSSQNGINKRAPFTIHVLEAELQFEADVLNKWEVFFLHLRPDIQDLHVVLIAQQLNPSNLPLDLLARIRLCENCRQRKRRVAFNFVDKKSYIDYKSSAEFVQPDIVCSFNPSIQRASIYNGKDIWPATINCVLNQKVPFLVTSHTQNELLRDLSRIKECSQTTYDVILEPKFNSFAGLRPDRNFISDDEMPLLFKNYCLMILCGV